MAMAGDFYLKRSERHVHDSADHPCSDANRRVTDVAVQRQLGILPKRRSRLDIDHCACVGVGGPRLGAQESSSTGHISSWPELIGGRGPGVRFGKTTAGSAA